MLSQGENHTEYSKNAGSLGVHMIVEGRQCLSVLTKTYWQNMKIFFTP